MRYLTMINQLTPSEINHLDGLQQHSDNRFDDDIHCQSPLSILPIQDRLEQLTPVNASSLYWLI